MALTLYRTTRAQRYPREAAYGAPREPRWNPVPTTPAKIRDQPLPRAAYPPFVGYISEARPCDSPDGVPVYRPMEEEYTYPQSRKQQAMSPSNGPTNRKFKCPLAARTVVQLKLITTPLSETGISLGSIRETLMSSSERAWSETRTKTIRRKAPSERVISRLRIAKHQRRSPRDRAKGHDNSHKPTHAIILTSAPTDGRGYLADSDLSRHTTWTNENPALSSYAQLERHCFSRKAHPSCELFKSARM
ncbi:unnamed protein product, partial [Trichogramma brassicae]